MQVDYALILSAGMGTRMGEIGKKIPKVMWPIFEKKLIDLQIDYCRDLGIKKIFINTHYLAEIIESHIEKKYQNEIVILHENPLLDSGGALHNMANHENVKYAGNVLMVNGDQFLFFEPKYIETALSQLRENRAVLFGIKVEKDSNYNETKTKNGKLYSIEKPTKLEKYVTYSGLGLLKLDGLKKITGVSKFFDTVVDYKNESVQIITPDSEYWDFGTADIYASNIFRLLDEKFKNSKMINFLKKHNGYPLNTEKFVNLNLGSINLESENKFIQNSIIGHGIVQKLT